MNRKLTDSDIFRIGFLEVLRETVALFSERPAVIYNEKKYSYHYLWNSALCFSEFLKSSTSPFTGLCFQESPEYIQTLLSVWMA
ncbi:MAG TPA: hypothetical protein PKK05_25020, partial [Leptospiraceae bacterium]|nr:hypothetical protein [Leptospiraceae bacterium]